MQSTRKRRAASLTAEALWTIQMDDVGSSRTAGHKSKSTTKHPTASSSKSNVKKRKKDEKSDTTNKAMKVNANKRRSTISADRKISTDSSGAQKTKPTASVMPVKKNVDSADWPGSNISISLDNPHHVLLLPVSMSDVTLTSVPVLALPTSMNLKLVNCFGTSSSPVMNVRSLFRRHSNDHPQHIPHGNKFNERNTSTGHSQSSHIAEGSSESQTEPLNLKLGESTIPSYKTTIHTTTKEDLQSAVASLHVRRKEKSKGLILNKISENLQQKIMSRVRNDRFEGAYSPSSESSYSSESETVNSGRNRSRRRSINLRTKAAQGDDHLLPQYKSQSSEENNSWNWAGNEYYAMVYSVKYGRPVMRRCYPSMRRKNENVKLDPDDVVMVRDCVAMRAHMGEQPYIAKIVALWEEASGSMMISLLWYYRPEHTEDPKVDVQSYNTHELFASRHLDEISVACVEEKCFVLTYNEYCRYQANDRLIEDYVGAQDGRQIVPVTNIKSHRNIPTDIDCSLVFFCRRYYDIKSHRLLKQFPNLTALYSCDNVREEKNSAISTSRITK